MLREVCARADGRVFCVEGFSFVRFDEYLDKTGQRWAHAPDASML